MDATPPPAIHCEAPMQDVLLRVSGKPGPNWPAFLTDISHLPGNWIVVSTRNTEGGRELILRANPHVSYKAVTDVLFNAELRRFDTKVTFGAPRCSGTT